MKITYIQANSLSEEAVKEPFEVLLEEIAQKKAQQEIMSPGLKSKKTEFQELKLKNMPSRMIPKKEEGGDDCC